MKKYNRKTALFSPFKITLSALFAAIATAVIVVLSGTENVWCIICGGITVSLLICDLFIMIGAGGRYRFSNKYIEIFYQLLPYKKLDYSWFSTIVISNASYNNGFGYGINGNIPMQYRVKGKNRHTKVTYPFITLHKSQYPVDKIKEGMNSRDLFMINSDEIYCLGICWVDSLKELLKYTTCSVYVLEDVYLRFQGQFDGAFSLNKENLARFYIITDHIIDYQVYFEEKSV